MKHWHESQEEVRKVKKDFEMAKSILKMMETRFKAAEKLNSKEFISLKLESYYEIIKEGITALIALEGYKTLSHEVLIGFLAQFYKEFGEYDILLIDQLRQLRNKIVYKGLFIEEDYLKRNEEEIRRIIDKLRKSIKSKLNY